MIPLSIKDVRVGVIMPTRGTERLEFVKNALRMMGNQTLKPVQVEVMGDSPINDQPDITYRYRVGYSKLKDVDIIVCWEDDDWYAPDYIERMVEEWDKAGRPDLFGIRFCVYYHLKLKKYFTFRGEQASHMSCTLIKPNLSFFWGQDTEPYTDSWLWGHGTSLSRALCTPRVMMVGMKHGVGMVGGYGHSGYNAQYINDDPNMYWLKTTMSDPESFDFYSKLSETL